MQALTPTFKTIYPITCYHMSQSMSKPHPTPINAKSTPQPLAKHTPANTKAHPEETKAHPGRDPRRVCFGLLRVCFGVGWGVLC